MSICFEFFLQKSGQLPVRFSFFNQLKLWLAGEYMSSHFFGKNPIKNHAGKPARAISPYAPQPGCLQQLCKQASTAYALNFAG